MSTAHPSSPLDHSSRTARRPYACGQPDPPTPEYRHRTALPLLSFARTHPRTHFNRLRPNIRQVSHAPNNHTHTTSCDHASSLSGKKGRGLDSAPSVSHLSLRGMTEHASQAAASSVTGTVSWAAWAACMAVDVVVNKQSRGIRHVGGALHNGENLHPAALVMPGA